MLPARLAFLPLLIATCHLPNLPVLELGVSFSPAKLMILAGLVRAANQRTLFWSSREPLDVLMAAFACWAVFSGFGHSPKDHNPIIIRLSLAYDFFGTYLYARSYLRNVEDFVRLGKCLALMLIPLALFMLIEKTTGRSVYAALLGMPWESEVREGRIRAAGPFSHPILAGTAGGTALVLCLALKNRHRWAYWAGSVACLVIIFSSASSGPIMTAAAGLGALALWRWRARMGWIKAAFLFAIIALDMVMKAPVWYLLARIDLAGGSTGWHRAELITAALSHLDEWWLVGTDYTRHWIPYGVLWSSDQIDITNYYLKMGVIGGILLMLIFIAILVKSFLLLGRKMQALRQAGDRSEFMLWCAGAALFSHCITFLGIGYFDQSYVFLFMIVGVVPALTKAASKRVAAVDKQSEQPIATPWQLPGRGHMKSGYLPQHNG